MPVFSMDWNDTQYPVQNEELRAKWLQLSEPEDERLYLEPH